MHSENRQSLFLFICREDYVQILKKYIGVDVFGSCGSLVCSKEREEGGGGHNSPECNEMLQRDYRYRETGEIIIN